MLPRLLDNTADARRDLLVWIALGALVVAQVVAFWMLCTHQVRKAEARETAIQSERMARADCLQYVPGATPGSCAAGAADALLRAQGPSARDAGGVLTIGFSR